MRPKERIPIFLKLVDRELLAERWTGSSGYINPLTGEQEEWLKVSDQRYGQFLINQELLPDSMRICSDEEDEILKDQGIDPKEFLLWEINYDKDRNPLLETQYKLCKDLDTDHIEKILEEVEQGMYKIPQLHIDTFKQIHEDRINAKFGGGFESDYIQKKIESDRTGGDLFDEYIRNGIPNE